VPRCRSGNGIEDPVQIRALELVTPRQFGILFGHGETTVEKWIRKGWVRRYTALDTSNFLIHISEVERFLRDRESEERAVREEIARGASLRAARAKASGTRG